MDSNSAETARLIGRAQTGDAAALGELFARHRARLRRMVEMRLDRRLQGRVDASDVIQEAYVDAARKPIDREIISLRHFEELTRAEAAQALGIEEAAAAKRYVRALKRLKDTLAGMPGGLEGL